MFHVGQKVCCIDIKLRPETALPNELLKLKKGNVYHISKIVTNTHGSIGIYLHEIDSTPGYSYFSDRFRPVVERKTNISIFTKLLNSKQHDLCDNHD